MIGASVFVVLRFRAWNIVGRIAKVRPVLNLLEQFMQRVFKHGRPDLEFVRFRSFYVFPLVTTASLLSPPILALPFLDVVNHFATPTGLGLTEPSGDFLTRSHILGHLVVLVDAEHQIVHVLWWV